VGLDKERKAQGRRGGERAFQGKGTWIAEKEKFRHRSRLQWDGREFDDYRGAPTIRENQRRETVRCAQDDQAEGGRPSTTIEESADRAKGKRSHPGLIGLGGGDGGGKKREKLKCQGKQGTGVKRKKRKGGSNSAPLTASWEKEETRRGR